MPGFVNRVNRVPHFQRMFQQGQKDGVRQWSQTPKSKILLTPYYIMLWGSVGGSLYMMCRQVLGKKTWWGEPSKN